VLYEVTYSGGFGGDGPDAPKPCSLTYEHPEVGSGGNIDAVNWNEYFTIIVCGWQPNEKIQIMIQNEAGELIYDEEITAGRIIDGEEIITDDNPLGDNVVTFRYSVPINIPYGLYNVIFEGEQSGRIIQNLTIEKPTSSRVYRYDGKLILHNFKPNESVRLLGYTIQGEEENLYRCYLANHPDTYGQIDVYILTAWQDYQVDDQGNLVIQLTNDTDAMNIVTIGEFSSNRPNAQPFPWIRQEEQISQKEWACRRWDTFVSNAIGYPSELKIQYNLTESIYDGNESFPPGTYHQIKIVINNNLCFANSGCGKN
jgi:hypothetical protein